MKTIPVRLLQSQQEPALLGSFTIRAVEELLAGKDMIQELHRHDYFYVLALKNGTGQHEIDFTPYNVCDHSVFFMRPGHVHQLTLHAGSNGFLMQFKSDFYFPNDPVSAQLLRKASNKGLCQLDSKQFEKLHALLSTIFQEYTDRQERYQEVIQANLGIFFIELVRHRQHTTPITMENSYLQERLEELMELLETHVAAHKSVSYYAACMHLSIYQLNAITKATLGKTCTSLITDSLLLESKRYLLATSNQVNQIAFQLGYEDVSYFIRFFKKHTGFSPEAFRKNFN